ncbi:DUF4431 domain-containing protein [Halomonas janggokensis]|uniref:DUF4431 domain-containing protein n=1 Tax=Vreelandella janggokensis TaxID=370767 RepID=A0ABT4ISA7_9GAMM|nr:DUF4431 domain-containing protein [Halomonas janggokensis]MCZ0926345.1 DUF4431 domain-containing protein [Halomonas janggokensis]MCZ0928883.1 DUF4431 domain-containing protein [Halomonas janggokensis]
MPASARIAPLIFFLMFLPAGAALAEGNGGCLVDGESAELTGKIWRETFPGPPNYESVESGDQPVTYWILTTDQPYCGKAYNMESGDTYRLPNELTRFQLVLDSDQYTDNQSLVFENATVTGSMFSGHTGHHNTAMLIDVESIERASE